MEAMNIPRKLPPLQPNNRPDSILQQLITFLKTPEGLKLLNESIKKIERPSSRNCYLSRLTIIKSTLNLPSGSKSLVHLQKTLCLSKPTLLKWMKRFLTGQADWFVDRKRDGRPCKISSEQLIQIHRAVHAKPKDLALEASIECVHELLTRSVWTLDTLSKFVHVNQSTLHRCLKRLHIKSLSETSTWCLSLDPDYFKKAERVHEVYTKIVGQEDSVVICFDEKTCIQSISYNTYIIKNGERRIDCRYTRNGTSNLCAFLNVATGKIYHMWLKEKRKTDICNCISKFCNRAEFIGKKIYIILDNLSTHKKFNTVYRDWYEKYPNVEFVFTPTCSSWMNLIESSFGIITRQVLKGASWHSVEELQTAVNRHIEIMNLNSKPYQWNFDIARNKSQRVHTLASMAQTAGLKHIKLLVDSIETVYGKDHSIFRRCPIDYLNGYAHIKHTNTVLATVEVNAIYGASDFRTACTVIK